MKKALKWTLIATGISTAISAVVLPIGFTNIVRINNENKIIEKQNTLIKAANNNGWENNPANPNLKNPKFCDGWIITVTVIITVNSCLIVTLIILCIYYAVKKPYKIYTRLSDF